MTLEINNQKQASQSLIQNKLVVNNGQMALRGCMLANTEWIIGVAVYTGKESKIILNLGNKRQKQSTMEIMINKIVIFLLLVQTILCAIMALYHGSSSSSLNEHNSKYSASYVFKEEANNGQEASETSPTLEAAKIYVAYFLLLNTLIPISLIVSLEVDKFLISVWMEFDAKFFCDITMKLLHVQNMQIPEDLAKVKYIFADKTGTLTANVMEFKGCSIGSVCYDSEYREDNYEYNYQDEEGQEVSEADRNSIVSSKLNEFKIYIKNKERGGSFQPKFNEIGKEAQVKQRLKLSKILWEFNPAVILKQLFLSNKSFNNEKKVFGKELRGGKIYLNRQNDYLHWFWVNVTVCHDVMVTFSRDEKKEVVYQGQSPDEITLLDAAKEVGYIFTEKTQSTITIEILGQDLKFDLLYKIEFSSERQMMSVIVRDPVSGCILLFSKGADSKIISDKYLANEQFFVEVTEQDLMKFSKKGYRTLCFGMKYIQKSSFDEWLKEVTQLQKRIAKAAGNQGKITVFAEQLTKKYEQIETGLFLMGATALEDKLQEGVAESIQDLNLAGIKVWMLTGDKLETAFNIGYSCKMFTDNMQPFTMRQENCYNIEKITEKLALISEKILMAKYKMKTKIMGSQYIINAPDVMDFRESPLKMQHSNSHRSCELSLGSHDRAHVIKRRAQKIINELVPDKQQVVRNLLARSCALQSKSPAQQQIEKTLSRQDLLKPCQKEQLLFGLVLEGAVLSELLLEEHKAALDRLVDVLLQCEAVVVCRASPSQKARVVGLVQARLSGAVALAVGDGANDVGMIAQAGVGVGIFGNEGCQAAGAADYAVGRFKHLNRLLFVHGRQCGVRVSTFVSLFFYKNLVFALPQFFYGLFNGYSAQTFWDEWFILAYNSWATAFGVCCFVIWDWDILIEKAKNYDVIKQFWPFLYKFAEEEESFTMKKFLLLVFMAFFHSILLFSIPMYTITSAPSPSGRTLDQANIQIVCFICICTCHFLCLFLFARHYSPHTIFCYSGSFLCFCPLSLVLPNLAPASTLHLLLWESLTPHSLLVLALVTTLTCLPVYLHLCFQRLVFPSLKHLVDQDRLDFNEIRRQLDPTQRDQLKEQLRDRAMGHSSAEKEEYFRRGQRQDDSDQTGNRYNTLHSAMDLDPNQIYLQSQNDSSFVSPKGDLSTDKIFANLPYLKQEPLFEERDGPLWKAEFESSPEKIKPEHVETEMDTERF